jgi:hypothetical protein
MAAQLAMALLALAAAPEKQLAAARPGDRVVIAPGEYGGFRLSGVRGLRGRPIVVVAKGAVFKGGIQLSDVEHLEIEGLVVQGAHGNGINIDDGGTFDTPSHDVVLRDVTVRDCGGGGNHDGIKLSGVEDFVLERCTVERWGRGGSAVDMVGCRRGVIDGCTFRDREEGTAATGVQAKGGSRGIVIRRCRFEHAGTRAVNIGGSTGLPYFRPEPLGFEAKDVTVEGCTFVGSLAPVAFVGVDGATVRFNTFYRPRKWFLRILQETREEGFVPCRGGRFTDNLVAYRSDEVGTPVNVGDGTAPETFEFARNYWFCIDDPRRGPPRLPVAEKDPAGGRDPLLREDLTLPPASPARAHGAAAFAR